jgi:hypothetical protein
MFKAQSNLNTVINVRFNNSIKAQKIPFQMQLNPTMNMSSNKSLKAQRNSEERLKGRNKNQNGPSANGHFKAIGVGRLPVLKEIYKL